MPRVPDQESETGVVTLERPAPRTRTPRLYKVLLHNDDFTTRDFVVFVLQRIFHKSEAEATEIMWRVHREGVGVAGVFTHEVAETKAARTVQLARQNEFPLRSSVEPE